MVGSEKANAWRLVAAWAIQNVESSNDKYDREILNHIKNIIVPSLKRQAQRIDNRRRK